MSFSIMTVEWKLLCFPRDSTILKLAVAMLLDFACLKGLVTDLRDVVGCIDRQESSDNTRASYHDIVPLQVNKG